MNRLPVCDKKITLMLEFLKSNKDVPYTARQVADYLWSNYSYCDFKTFAQLIGEVGEKLNVHINGKDTEIMQVVRHNTRPATYQWKDPYDNTASADYQTAFDFEEEPKCLQTAKEEEEVIASNIIEEDFSEEQSLLMEDVKAASKINSYNIDLLRQYLSVVSNKHEAIKEIMQVLMENI
jgi:hypothetical protein